MTENIERCNDMSTVNGILKSFSLLSPTDQNHLKSILLSADFVNSLNIEQFVYNDAIYFLYLC